MTKATEPLKQSEEQTASGKVPETAASSTAELSTTDRKSVV